MIKKILFFLTICLCVESFALEKIVIFRHAERSADSDIGQLSCKGLNRSLALPLMLEKRFGKPAFIFAANPFTTRFEYGVEYSSARPFTTIVPMSIQYGLKPNAQYSFDEIDAITAELLSPKYKDSLVYVCWEHEKILDIVATLLKGTNYTLPKEWPSDDFDTILIITVDQQTGKRTFEIEKEDPLDLKVHCPI